MVPRNRTSHPYYQCNTGTEQSRVLPSAEELPLFFVGFLVHTVDTPNRSDQIRSDQIRSLFCDADIPGQIDTPLIHTWYIFLCISFLILGRIGKNEKKK